MTIDNDRFFCSNKGQVCTELLEFCPIPLNFSCMVCLLGTHLQSQLLIFLWLRSYLTGRLIFKQQDQTFSTQGVEHNESYFFVQGRLVWQTQQHRLQVILDLRHFDHWGACQLMLNPIPVC